MRTAAIIPVKRFEEAKTRLGLGALEVAELCGVMLREIIGVVSTSSHIDHTFVVTRDAEAERIVAEFGRRSGKGGGSGITTIRDEHEMGVNEAVALADRRIIQDGYDASIVMPQDIPYIKAQDIDFVMRFAAPPNFAVIVPSRKFDGTNVLVRMPADLMGTHYDDDSYREHVRMAGECTRNVAPVFVRRIMMDVDTMDDLRFLLANSGEKPHVAIQIERIAGRE